MNSTLVEGLYFFFLFRFEKASASRIVSAYTNKINVLVLNEGPADYRRIRLVDLFRKLHAVPVLY